MVRKKGHSPDKPDGKQKPRKPRRRKKTGAPSGDNKKVVRDPYAGREAEKYSKPIASREWILELVEQQGRPVSFTELVDLLEITSEDEQGFTALKRRVKAMVRDGQLVLNRRGAYGLPDKMSVVKGRVSANAGGFGFLIPEEGGGDLFLSPGQMKALFDGDVILAKISGVDRRGRKEGRVVDILERNTHEVVGRCFFESGVGILVPDNKKIPRDILLVGPELSSVENGQMVVAEISKQPDYRSPAMAKVVEVLGEHMAPGMEVEVAIRSHQLPHIWPDSLLSEAEDVPDSISDKEIGKRVDLRDQPFCTIDGEDARDFDDAVLCQRYKQGWRLIVAIADVGHYVERDSELDKEAVKRGNSVYFPQRVIPMLPEKLSNGLCSLNPDVDRLTLACEMIVDSEGELKSFSFMEAVIHSRARLTYTEVADFLDNGVTTDALLEVSEEILAFHELFGKLHKIREQRGAISVESTEVRFVFNEDKKIEAVLPVERNVAHQMIEEAMLLANTCAADLLAGHKLPALYRVHEAPGEEKIQDLKEYLEPLGFRFSSALNKDKRITPSHLQEIVSFAEERPDRELINTIVLRSMQQAIYSDKCGEHFGLAYERYTHFTSPIRRYPDLIAHRAIKYFVRSDTASKQVRKVKGVKPLDKKRNLITREGELHESGEHFSYTERRADLASRDAMDWLKCEFMQDKVGEIFSGKISSVTPFGFFVLLDEYFIEGLVHISDLKKDYYHYDERRHELQAEQSHEVFCLADSVKIQVARVSLEDKKIEFVLEGEDHLQKFKRSPRPSRRGKTRNKKNGEQKPKGRKKGNKTTGGKAGRK